MEGHGERSHALLSASGAIRWMSCPPSARLAEKVPPTPSSIYAEEGELAHELAEIKIRSWYEGWKKADETREEKKITSRLARLMPGNPGAFAEMSSEVDKYANYVIELYSEASEGDPVACMFTEVKSDFSRWVPDGFGTTDQVILSGDRIDIVDLKYGKGIQVDAQENFQMMLYALGIAETYNITGREIQVKLHIVQPRINNWSTWSISLGELLDWAEGTLKPVALKAFRGEGEKKAGSWCKFCAVKAVCRENAEMNMSLAAYDFRDPDIMSTKELVEVFEKIPGLRDWAEAVGDHLLKEALAGKEVAGYKVVEGRSMRRWTDEKGAAARLKQKKFKVSEFMVTKLGGIGHIEGLVGKKDFPVLLGDFVEKPPGKPALVPETDKRPPLNISSAQKDFGS